MSTPTLSTEERLYRRAVLLVIADRRCRITMLQRRFAVGYTIAARLAERMQADGIVGPFDRDLFGYPAIVDAVPDHLVLPA